MPRRLFLVRHGAVENPENLRYGGLPGFPLSQRGRAQAASAARYLKGCSLSAPLVLSSPLTRAVETAEILGDALRVPVHLDHRLREIGSRYDGLPWKFVPLAYWHRGRDPAFLGHDEPVPLAAARLLEALREAHRGHPGDLIAVSHQLPLRAALLALTRGLGALDGPLPWPLWLRLRQPLALGYAQVLELDEVGGGRWRLAGGFRPEDVR